MNRELENEIKEAFEHMGPSEGTQKRMLENILTTTTDSVSTETEFQPIKKRPARIFALPIAAALILLVGVGLLTTMNHSQSTPKHVVYESAPSSKNIAGSGGQDYADQSVDSVESLSVFDFSFEYPYIESDSLGKLHVIDKTADEALVDDKIESTQARNTDGTQTIGCIIYQYGSSDSEYYAIQYDGDTTFYLAQPLSLTK